MSNLFRKKVSPPESMSPKAICVWGTHGAPGRTTIAINLACELALNGARVLLIDLDSQAPSIADCFGLLDEKPGVAAAFRLVGQGRLDLAQIERLSTSYDVAGGRLSVMTGLRAANRWPELTREKTQSVITIAKQHFDFVIMDVSADLEVGIRQIGGVVDRNCTSRTALEVADQAIAVFSADPIGVRRLVDSFQSLSELFVKPILVANRLRASSIGPSARQQIEDAVMQLCRLEVAAFVALDIDSCDKAIMQSVPLAMMKRTSKARQAIAQLARLNFGTESQGWRG
jgi:MinD-like ATPase involved in chromosome partitioning or flagellar assembly